MKQLKNGGLEQLKQLKTGAIGSFESLIYYGLDIKSNSVLEVAKLLK